MFHSHVARASRRIHFSQGACTSVTTRRRIVGHVDPITEPDETARRRSMDDEDSVEITNDEEDEGGEKTWWWRVPRSPNGRARYT